MAIRERELKRKQTPKRSDEVTAAPQATKQADALKAELDDLIDSIDEVLEENAEEFVRAYVQKGGQ